MEKKKIKISLGTVICIFIIVILLIIIGTMYCKLRENSKELETNKEEKEIKQEENNNVINKIYEEIEQINSLNIYTDNIEKKNDIPEKFNNENYIYRRSNIFTKI